MKYDKIEDMHTTTAALPKQVSSPFCTEKDDDGPSYEESGHWKSSLKRHHIRHRKLEWRSSSSPSSSQEMFLDDSDLDLERKNALHRRRSLLSRESSAESDDARIHRHKHRNEKDNSLKVLRPVNDCLR